MVSMLHWKTSFLGVEEKPIYRVELPKKGGAWTACRFAFDIVNHKILLSELEHCRKRGMPLKLFQNYLMNWTQFIEINKKKLNCTSNKLWSPPRISSWFTTIRYLCQWSKWWCYTFKGSSFCEWHKFIIYQQFFERYVNRKVNYDLRHVVECLRANKILLDSGKKTYSF